MIGGCEQEMEFKMNPEQASPGSESNGPGCLEGADYLQKYFGQSGYHHHILSPADQLGVGVSARTMEGMGDEITKSSDQMEFDAELRSIFFGTEGEQPHHKNLSSVEKSEPGGLLRNQKVEATNLEEDSTLQAGPLTRLGTEWSWPNDRTAENDSSEEEREVGWGGNEKDVLKNFMTDGPMDEDVQHHHKLEERNYPSGDIDRYQIAPSEHDKSTNRNRNTHNIQHDLFMSEPSLHYVDSTLPLNPVASHKPMHYPPPYHLDPSYNHLYHQMSLPNKKWSNAFPLDFPPFCTSLSNPASQPDPIDQLLGSAVTEDDQHLIDLEFNHLVAEEQCAPSTPSSSLSTQGRSTHRSKPKQSLKANFTQPFLSIDPLSGLFDQASPSLYPPPPPALKDLHDLNDSFSSLINSTFDLYPTSSTPSQLVSSVALPPSFSNPFLSGPPASTAATIHSSLVSHPHPSPLPLVDHSSHQQLEPSLPSTSSLPSPSNLSHPAAASTPRFTPRNRIPSHCAVVQSLESRDPHKNNPLLDRSQSNGSLNKSNTATAEVPTEVELAIPRLHRLNLSESYPEDLNLFLIGLQAQGAKTRVETQIKLTLVLVTGQGGSIDRNGNLSTETPHSLKRIGNWSHIKLPVYSAIKRKSKKLIKTGIPPEETLFLEVAVVRASEPQDEIYCCSNCQVREQKRTQRKRDARVRPAQEIDSDEAEQSIRPEDEKRKIVVFNCGQYVGFESGEVTLPTRITCYCRHHREKKGFRVKITLRDHTHRLIATSITPAIMITDDHKAVAAAAKAKSGSDAEDNHSRGRLIRRLPNTNLQSIPPGLRRGRKKALSPSIGSTSEPPIASGSTEDKDGYDSVTGWTSVHRNDVDRTHSRSQSSSRSASTKCKRKAPNEFDLRGNIGRKTSSNQTAASAQIVEPSDSLSAAGNTGIDGTYQHIQLLGCPCPLQESRPHSPTSARSLSISMPSLANHLRSATPAGAYLWHDCPSFPKSTWQEEISIPQHSKFDAPLALSIDVKDLIHPLRKAGPECLDADRICSPPSAHLNGTHSESSMDYCSNIPPPHLATMADTGVGPQLCELAGLGNQGCPTSQERQNAGRPALTCSTTSSPDQAVIFPCSAHASTSPTSACSATSPKSSIDSRLYTQFKCSNPVSPSSSIVCTQSRDGSDSSSHTCESSRSLHILPSPSGSPQEQIARNLGDQPEPYCKNLDDISRTSSPVNNTSTSTLGNGLANWNILSSLHPPSSQALDVRTSPNSFPDEILPKSPETAYVHPVLNGETSSEPQRNHNQPQAKFSKLIPNEGPMEGGVEIAILGSNFYPGIKVDFGSAGVVPTEFWSNNTLICVLPPSARPGPCEVTMVEEGDIERPQNKSSGQIFTYVNQADQRLVELALHVVGLKMTGQVQDARSPDRKIILETEQFESFSEAFLNHTVDSMKEINYECQKIHSMGLKVLETLEDDRRQIDEVGSNFALLGPTLSSYIEEKGRELSGVK